MSLSRLGLFVTPWTVADQTLPSVGFSRQEYWSGLPFPSPGDLPDPGTEPGPPALQADTLPSKPPGKNLLYSWVLLQKNFTRTPTHLNVHISPWKTYVVKPKSYESPWNYRHIKFYLIINIWLHLESNLASLMAQWVKNPPAMQEIQEMWIRSQGQEKPLEEENHNPLQYSCLKNPMDRGAWWTTVHGVAKSCIFYMT